MEFHQNAVYSPSSFQDFALYQDPEEAGPTPSADPWEEMGLNENVWNTHSLADIEPTAPHFIEVPRVPQISTLYPPHKPLSPYPDQQLVSLPEFEC